MKKYCYLLLMLVLSIVLGTQRVWAQDPCTLSITASSPYVENFDSYTGVAYNASGVLPDCWSGFSSGTNSVYNPHIVGSGTSYYYCHSGTKALVMTSGTTTTYGSTKYVKLPAFDQPLNSLMLTFWMCTESSSYGELSVGYITAGDTDYSSFTVVRTIPASAATLHSGSGLQTTAGATYEIVLSQFPANADRLVLYWTSSGTYYSCCLDDVVVSFPPSCPKVDNIVLSPMPNSVDVSWTEMGSASNWIVEIYSGSSLVSTELCNVPSASISNLNPSTNYSVNVRAICGVGDTSAACSASFQTPCAAIAETALPYSYNFDNATASGTDGQIDACWGRHVYGSTTNYPYPYTTYKHSGSYSMYFYNTSSVYSWLVLPLFENNVNTLQLSFWAYKTSATYGHIFVGVMSNPDDVSTFDTIADLQVANTSAWEYFEVPLSQYAGMGRYITLLAKSSTTNYTYIDDVSVDFLPSCPRPTDLSYNNLGASSVDLSWTENGTADSWIVDLYKGDTLVQSDYANTTNYSFDYLESNTEYTVEVRAFCGVDDTSEMAAITFRTACTAIPEGDLPYTYDFDDATASGTNGQIDACWGRHVYGSTTNYPYPSSTQRHSDNYALYFYNTSNMSTYSWATLPMFESDLSTLQLSFWAYKTAANYGHVLVGVMTNPDDITTFDTIAELQVSDLNAWEYYEVPLNNYMGNGGYIAFYASANVANYIYIDDVTVDYLPQCPRPTDVVTDNVTATSVDLSWTENGSASSWVVQYTTTDFAGDNFLSEEVYSNPYTLMGLNPSSNYSIRVAALCYGDTSTFSEIAVSTLCGELDLPFVYGFENDATGSTAMFPHCWTRHNDATGSSNYYPYVNSSTSNAHSGSKYLYFYQYNSTSYADNQYAVLPAVNTDNYPMEYNEMLFWAKMSTATAVGELIVGVMDDPDSIETFVPVDTISISGNAYQIYTVSFAGYEGTGKHIAIRGRKLSSSVTTYVDDIEVRQASTCPTPENPHIAAIASDEVTIEWSSNSEHSSYVVYYGPVGFGSDIAQQEWAYDTTITLYNLDANTAYEYYIVASCSGTDANPTARYAFRTKCNPVETDSLPYVENFESYTSGSANGISPCWTKGTNNSTAYPYPNSTTPINGSMSLYFNSTTSNYSYAALPAFEAPINTLSVNFNMKAYSTLSSTYGAVMLLGVMSNPDDISTFDTVAVFDMSNGPTNAIENFEYYLDQYSGDGTYIAFMAPVSNYSNNYVKLDDITVELIPDCRRSTDLEVAQVTPFTAELTWHNASEYVDSYQVVYSLNAGFDPDTCTNVLTVTDTTVTLTGLESFTQYYWAVKAVCSDTTLCSRISQFRTSFDCGTNPNVFNVLDTIGNGTTAGYTYFLYGYSTYPYGKTSIIYTAQELNAMGLLSNNRINSVSVKCSSGGTLNNVHVYAAETDMAGFASTPDTMPVAQMTEVFYGNLTAVNGSWMDIHFNDDFVYSGNRNLMLVFLRDTAASPASTSGITFYYGSTSPDYLTAYSYKSSATATMSNTRSTSRVNMAFNICSEIPSCDRPENLAIVGLSSDSASFTWNGSSASYEYIYGPTGYNPDSTDLEINYVSGNAVSIQNLTPNSAYTFYVRSVCSAGEHSDWSFAQNFTTPCAAQQIPYTEDFESYSSGASYPISSCWKKGTNSTTQYPYPYATNPISGNNSLYFYAYHPSSTTTTSIYSYAALPLMAAPLDTLMLSFDMRRYQTTTSTYTSRLVVGVMSDPSDITTFVPVDTIDMREAAALAIRHFEVTFENYQGDGQFIAFYDEVPPFNPGATSTYSYLYLDNVNVDYVPSCRTPQDVVFSNITGYTATVSRQSLNGEGTTWELEYGPTGFMQGSGTTMMLTADSVVLTGLNSSTYYDVYVRDYCSASDISEWSPAYTFSTPCGIIDVLPYSNGFEFEQSGGASVTTYPQFVTCWSRFNNSTSASYQGYPYVYSTISSVYEGARCLYFYAAATTTTTAYPQNQIAILPQIDTTVFAMNNLQLGFWAKRSTYRSFLQVGVMSDPTDLSTFQIVDTIIPATSYTYYEVPLSGFNGHGSYIALRLDRGDSVQYVYLDNVELDEIPSCLRPDNLSVDSVFTTGAVLGWYAHTGETQWAIEYGPEGFVPGQGTTVIVNSNPSTITGLSPATFYEAYVRSICGADDTSYYSRESVRFATTQVPANLPYTYDFENAAEWNNWQTRSNVVSNWYRGTDAAGQGSYAMYVSSDNGDTRSVGGGVVNAVAYRDIDFGTTPAGYQLDFKAMTGGTYTNNYDGFAVALVDPSVAVVPSSTGLNSPWGHVNDITLFTMFHDTVWNNYSVMLDGVSGVKRIAFYYFRQNSSNIVGGPAAIDSIVIRQQDCERPYALGIDTLTQTTADLTWSGEENASYLISYRRVSDASGSEIVVPVLGTSYQLINLDEHTDYVFWVRKDCGTDTSVYSPSRRFTTLCSAFSAIDTISEGFESIEGVAYNAEGTLPNCWEGYSNGTDASYVPHVVGAGTTYWYTHTGTKSIVMTSGNGASQGNTKIVRMPLTSEPINTLKLSYWMCTESATNGTLSVGYMVGDDFENDFVAIKSVPACSASVKTVSAGLQPEGVGILDTVTFEDAPDSAMYIAFKWVYDGVFYSVCVDDVEITSSATCIVPETEVAVTATSATISWQPAGEFNVSYRQESETDWSENQHITGATSVTLSNLAPATTYLYRMQKICESGDSSNYATGSFITDSMNCVVPTGLAVSNIQHDAVTLSWTAESTDAEYVAHVFSAHHDVYDTVTGATTTVTGLYAAEDYQVAIQRSCGFGYYSEWSDTLSFTTPTCQPVTNVTATAIVGTTNVTVAWTAAAGSDTWQIVYGYDGFGQGEGVTITVTTNPYVVTGLEEMTPYDFYVRTVCGEGWNSNWSNVAHATTDAPDVPCATVEGVTTNVTDNSVAISWTAVENAQIYELEYGVAGFVLGTGTAVNNLGTTNYTANNLAAGNYEVYVRANCGETNYGPWSQATQFTIVATCDPVTNVTASAIEGSTNVSVAWTAPAGSDTWQIEYGPTGFVHGNGIIFTATENPALLTGLEAETAYDFYVRTVCGEGLYSEWSAVAHATTDAPDIECGTVEGVTVNVDGNYVVIYWNSVENADSYELEYGTVGFSFGQGTSVDNLATLAYAISEMPNGNYEVYVRANCGENNYGPWSQSTTFSVMVGINDADDNMQLSLYPNPATQVTTISLSGFAGKVNVEVVDLNGRVAASETMECDGNCVKTMNVNSLAQGTYFVRVYGDTVNMVRKLVVR